MSDLLEALLGDLRAEGDQLWSTVAGLDADGWATPTPAPGGSVATQVAHLAWTDEVAALAARSHTPEGKAAWDEVVLAAMDDPAGFVDTAAEEVARLAPEALLARSPELEIAIAAEDGERYGVADGEWVRVRSRRGELEGRVLYTEKMRKGEMFVPFVKLQEHAANFLTNSAFDPDSKIPEYKVCAVRIEKIGAGVR